MSIVNRAQLINSLDTFSKIKIPQSILSTFLVSSKDGIMTLKSFDVKTTTIIEIPCTGDDMTEFAINREVMTLIAKSNKDATIEVSEKNAHDCEVSAVESYRNMMMESVKAVNTITVPSSTIQHIVERVEKHVSSDETRYFMNGIYFEVLEGSTELNVVATDGKTLAQYNNESLGYQCPKLSAIVPVNAFKFPKKATGKVNLTFSDKHVMVELIQPGQLGTSYKRITSLIDGHFPMWRRVLPDSFRSSIAFNAEAMRTVLKAIKPFVTKSQRIFVTCADGKDTIISVRDNDAKNIEFKIASNTQLESFEFACSREFLYNCVEFLEGGFTLEVNDPNKPMQIKQNGFTKIIMPMIID